MTDPTLRITAALPEGAVNTDTRTLTGPITEYGAVGYTSAGRTRWEPGSLTPLEAARAVKLLEQHDSYSTALGYMTAFEDDPTLPRASMYVVPDSAGRGDAALEAADNGTRDAFSVGVQIDEAHIDDDGVLVVTAGTIYEISLVTIPAFFNARLDAATVSAARAALAPVITTATTDAAPAPSATAGRPAPTQEDTTMGDALAPVTAADPATLEAAEQLGAQSVYAALVGAKTGDHAAEQVLAALSDIKHSGSGALPATGVLQPHWVGEVWNGRTYARRFLPLAALGIIQSITQRGFRLNQDTALVQHWNGNKSTIGSGTASTALVESTLRKYGYAADIAREFYDLPGGTEVIEAFWRGVVNSYAKITDEDALLDLITAAGTPIAPDTYPTDYPPALGMLIQGIEAVEDANDTPSYAIASPAAWKQMLYTPKDKVPEFVKFAFATTHDGTADGKVTVVRGDLGMTGPAVLVGSKSAVRFNELGTTPVQFDALNVAQGGIDKGVVGYLQTFVEYPDAIVLVGDDQP